MTDSAPAIGRDDRRRELRMTSDKEIKVMLFDGSVTLLGTLFDLSLSGARVRVPLKIETGRKIELIFEDQQQRIPSTVVWHSETEIGIVFDATSPLALLGG